MATSSKGRRRHDAARRRRRGTVGRSDFPTLIERGYAARIRREIVEPLRAEYEKKLRPLLDELVELEERGDSLRRDATEGELRNELAKLLSVMRSTAKARRSAASKISAHFANQTNAHARRALAKQISKRVEVPADRGDPALAKLLDDWQRDNADLIKTIDARFFPDVEELVRNHFEGGLRSKTLRKQVEGRFEVSRSIANRIARDQIGKLTGNLVAHRQQKVGITHYFWRTSRDERVVGNPSGLYPVGNSKHGNHWIREGKRYSWKKGPADGHPGHPIQCRCHAEPDLDSITGDVGKAKKRPTANKPKRRRKPTTRKTSTTPKPTTSQSRTEARRAQLAALQRSNRAAAARLAKQKAVNARLAKELRELEAQRRPRPGDLDFTTERARGFVPIHERADVRAELPTHYERDETSPARVFNLDDAKSAASRFSRPGRPPAGSRPGTGQIFPPESDESVGPEMRKHVNTLLGQYGMTSKDLISKRSERATLTHDRNTPYLGWHSSWTGEIALGSNGVDNLRDWGDGKNVEPWAFRTLVHEHLHAHSPMGLGTYKGAAKALEEATVEITARHIVKKATGKTGSRGSYQVWIDSLVGSVQSMLSEDRGVAVSRDEAEVETAEAAIRMRSGSDSPQGKESSARYGARFFSKVRLQSEGTKARGLRTRTRASAMKSLRGISY